MVVWDGLVHPVVRRTTQEPEVCAMRSVSVMSTCWMSQLYLSCDAMSENQLQREKELVFVSHVRCVLSHLCFGKTIHFFKWLLIMVKYDF